MPERIRLSRKQGFRLPPNTVSVARPTKWGNPVKVGPNCTHDQAVRQFRQQILLGTTFGLLPVTVADAIRELRGKNLACWCRLDAPCHADVLLELANREEPTDA